MANESSKILKKVQLVGNWKSNDHSSMETPDNIGLPTSEIGHADHKFWVVGHFFPLVGVIRRSMELALKDRQHRSKGDMCSLFITH